MVSDISAQFPEVALEAGGGQSFLYPEAVMHKEPGSPEGLEHAVNVPADWVIPGAGGSVQEAEELPMPSPSLALQGSPERCATAA